MNETMTYSRAAWLTLALGTILVVGTGCVGSASKSSIEQRPDAGGMTTRTSESVLESPGREDAGDAIGDTADENVSSRADDAEADAGTQVGAGVVREIRMTAKQWEFVPSEVRVDLGETVRLVVTSEDVAHGLMIPAFNVNQRIEPGQTVTVEFTADKAGEFPFFCNVFCGSGHKDMAGTLIVE